MTRVKIVDRPIHPNLANYEQRLKRMRHEIAMVLAQIDEALDHIDLDRKNGDASS